MTLKQFLFLSVLSGVIQWSTAQNFPTDVFESQRTAWLQKAEACKPQLLATVKRPVSIVDIVKDTGCFQGWKVEECRSLSSLYRSSFKEQSGVVVDFKEHLTGYFTIDIKPIGGTPDGPLRFRFTFGEVPSELVTPFEPYNGGLSRAWLQDEIVTVMDVPARVTIPRRVSFRYLKIDLLGHSPFFDFAITGMEVKATTSVGVKPALLAVGTSPMIVAIDRIGLATLKECMQTVYEDGPKRDRRLWIGDLYLEALANAQSFKMHDLTKRCLYLLAGLSRPDGLLHTSVFENPDPHPQTGVSFLFEYTLLYNVAVNDYLDATGDRATATDLWPVVKKQTETFLKYLKSNGMFNDQQATKDDWWLFVDWSKSLNRQASIQGIIIFCLKQSYELSRKLGRETELSHLPELIERMSTAARKNLYNNSTGLFESGPLKQVSYASQAWMIISGVMSKREGRRALQVLSTAKDVIKPGSPYLFHYVVEAMIKSGMNREAKQLIIDYWGGMVKKGADTFWEVYDPSDDYLSPYNFFPINSYCHAWSCSPVYFIRKYPDIFQN